MTSQGRVNRARERLESAQKNAADDPAIRIVKLNPPIEGGEPILLHRRLTVIRRLSDSGKRTLFDTISGMQRDAASPLHKDYSPSGDISPAMASELTKVVESCEQALLLSGAEIRGAKMALADLDEQLSAAQNSDDSGASAATLEFPEFVAQVLDAPADAGSIKVGLDALRTDPRRVALEAACALDVSNPNGSDVTGDGPKLFGSSNRVNTNLVRAEAEGELSEYDMSPGSPAYVLASRLDYVGIPASPFEAADIAARVLSEVEEAFAAKAAHEEAVRNTTGPVSELAEQRRQVLSRRSATERKIATQKQLMRLALAQLQIEAGHKPRGLMPVLIEDPFAELPDELTNPTLAMLLRHSEAAQVLIVTERSEVRAWCVTVEGDAGCVDARGWFAEEQSEW